MSVFWRRSTPQRSAGPGEVPPVIQFGDQYAIASSYADTYVSTPESAMQSIAVRSTADLIASLCSELPIEVYSGEGADKRKRSTPGYLLDPAGDGHGLQDWAYQALMSWLMRGNVYGDVLARTAGYATQTLLHHPDDVSGWLDSDGNVRWAVAGRPVTDESAWLHRRVNPVPGRIQGLSPIALHADQIGVTLSSTKFGLQWFRDGAHPAGMLTNEEVTLDKTQIATAKERFMAALRGTREPVVMGKGWKWASIQVSPEESQFLQTQGYTEAQCARIFGPGYAEILGYDSGQSMTYANVESRASHLLVFSLGKWFTRLERLLSEMLPRPQRVCIDRDALLQSTTLARYQAHESALKNRWKVVNEVRAAENLPPVDWGDQPNGASATPTDPADPADQQPNGAEAPQPKPKGQ